MAGDIPISESAVVLGPEGLAAASPAQPSGLRGRVIHQFGPRVLIGDLALAPQEEVEAAFGSVSLAPTPAVEIPNAIMGDLDDVGAAGLAALQLRDSPDFNEAKASRPYAEESWDTAEALSPDPPLESGGVALAPPTAAAAGAATSERMTSTVAVGVVIVSGPTADLQFSATEQTKVVAEVQNGLAWLASQQSSAGLVWNYDIRHVSITTTPGPDTLDFGQREARWRDPTTDAMGFGTGWGGITGYVQHLLSTLGTQWAYCAFFTKYPLGHFAYAGAPRVVMQYANDGWGPDNIDRVFAHETGHIFGAPDEYASSGCTCGGQFGYFQQPNGNCENCAPAGGVLCIMRANTWAMCGYTPGHFGWERNPNAQAGWRWCSKCQGLAFAGGNPGTCPAGGAHDHETSGSYSVLHDVQPPVVQANWRWCSKCEGMAFAGGGAGHCPAGGTHDHQYSGAYRMLHSLDPMVGQAGWRWCSKCQGLAFAGGGAGPCPAGGAHDHSWSGKYAVLHEVTNPQGQDNWRWCAKCQGLAFGGGSAGVCPAGGAHDHSWSGNYTALHALTDPTDQDNWRWCSKCQGLAFAGGGAGPCPAGSTHDHGGSGNYTLLHGLGIFQDNWRWCSKCQGLAFAGSAGHCPAGGAHEHGTSGNYTMLPT